MDTRARFANRFLNLHKTAKEQADIEQRACQVFDYASTTKSQKPAIAILLLNLVKLFMDAHDKPTMSHADLFWIAAKLLKATQPGLHDDCHQTEWAISALQYCHQAGWLATQPSLYDEKPETALLPAGYEKLSEAVPVVGPEGGNVPPVVTDLQANILTQLKGNALALKSLAKILEVPMSTVRSALYGRKGKNGKKGVKGLIAQGLVKSRSGRGYYRPAAPPNDLE